jgi:hypothetical protein
MVDSYVSRRIPIIDLKNRRTFTLFTIKTTNDQFIYTLLGNTQAAKRARLLTRVVDPKHHALWMLPDLYTYLCEYARPGSTTRTSTAGSG